MSPMYIKISTWQPPQESMLEAFLMKSTKEEQEYSLRATKKTETDAQGKTRITYELFKRNGKEGLFDRLVNWIWQEEQRENAKEAIKAGFHWQNERDKLDFNQEIDCLDRVRPGQELAKLVWERQLRFCAPPESLGITAAQIVQPDRYEKLPAVHPQPESSTVLDSTSGPLQTVSSKSFENPQKSKRKNFSLQSLFEFSPFFNKSSPKRVLFSKFAGETAKAIVKAKHRQSARAEAVANIKSLPDAEPSGIHHPRKVRSITAIQVKHMPDLDVQDLHPSVAVLMRNTNEYFAMTDQCQKWLQRRMAKLPVVHESAARAGMARIETGENIAYLAPHIESVSTEEDLQKRLARIADTYKQAIEDAVKNDRPIVLTPLFHYDEKTIDQYLGAMLRPVYEHLRTTKVIQLEIRTTCPKIAAALKSYQRQYPSSPPTAKGEPVPQIRKRLHEADLASEGMIMMTPEILSFAGKKSGKILGEAWARFKTQPGAERVQARKSLEENAWSRCYYFADEPAAHRKGGVRQLQKPEVVNHVDAGKITRDIETCYRAALKAAQDNNCRFLTLPSLETRFGAQVPEEAAALQIIGAIRKLATEFPEICITVLSDSPYIREHFDMLEGAA